MANGIHKRDRQSRLESWLNQLDPALQSYALQYRMTLTKGSGRLRDRSLDWRYGTLKLRIHIVLDDPTLITFTIRAMAWQTKPVERPYNRKTITSSVMGITLKSNLIAFLEQGRKLLEGWAEEALAGPDS